MKKVRYFLLSFLVLFSGLFFASCTDFFASFKQEEIYISDDEEIDLLSLLECDNYDGIEFQLSNSEIATLENGKIVPMGQSGKTQVIALKNGKKVASVNLYIKNRYTPISSFEVNGDVLSFSPSYGINVKTQEVSVAESYCLTLNGYTYDLEENHINLSELVNYGSYTVDVYARATEYIDVSKSYSQTIYYGCMDEATDIMYDNDNGTISFSYEGARSDAVYGFLYTDHSGVTSEIEPSTTQKDGVYVANFSADDLANLDNSQNVANISIIIYDKSNKYESRETKKSFTILETPYIQVSEGNFSINKIDGADAYEIVVNGQVEIVSSTTFDFCGYEGDLEVKVRAIKNETIGDYIFSNFTNLTSYKKISVPKIDSFMDGENVIFSMNISDENYNVSLISIIAKLNDEFITPVTDVENGIKTFTYTLSKDSLLDSEIALQFTASGEGSNILNSDVRLYRFTTFSKSEHFLDGANSLIYLNEDYNDIKFTLDGKILTGVTTTEDETGVVFNLGEVLSPNQSGKFIFTLCANNDFESSVIYLDYDLVLTANPIPTTSFNNYDTIIKTNAFTWEQGSILEQQLLYLAKMTSSFDTDVSQALDKEKTTNTSISMNIVGRYTIFVYSASSGIKNALPSYYNLSNPYLIREIYVQEIVSQDIITNLSFNYDNYNLTLDLNSANSFYSHIASIDIYSNDNLLVTINDIAVTNEIDLSDYISKLNTGENTLSLRLYADDDKLYDVSNIIKEIVVLKSEPVTSDDILFKRDTSSYIIYSEDEDVIFACRDGEAFTSTISSANVTSGLFYAKRKSSNTIESETANLGLIKADSASSLTFENNILSFYYQNANHLINIILEFENGDNKVSVELNNISNDLYFSSSKVGAFSDANAVINISGLANQSTDLNNLLSFGSQVQVSIIIDTAGAYINGQFVLTSDATTTNISIIEQVVATIDNKGVITFTSVTSGTILILELNDEQTDQITMIEGNNSYALNSGTNLSVVSGAYYDLKITASNNKLFGSSQCSISNIYKLKMVDNIKVYDDGTIEIVSYDNVSKGSNLLIKADSQTEYTSPQSSKINLDFEVVTILYTNEGENYIDSDECVFEAVQMEDKSSTINLNNELLTFGKYENLSNVQYTIVLNDTSTGQVIIKTDSTNVNLSSYDLSSLSSGDISILAYVTIKEDGADYYTVLPGGKIYYSSLPVSIGDETLYNTVKFASLDTVKLAIVDKISATLEELSSKQIDNALGVILSWSSIEKANTYEVYLNGIKVGETQNTSFVLSEDFIVGSNTIFIKAISGSEISSISQNVIIYKQDYEDINVNLTESGDLTISCENLVYNVQGYIIKVTLLDENDISYTAYLDTQNKTLEISETETFENFTFNSATGMLSNLNLQTIISRFEGTSGIIKVDIIKVAYMSTSIYLQSNIISIEKTLLKQVAEEDIEIYSHFLVINNNEGEKFSVTINGGECFENIGGQPIDLTSLNVTGKITLEIINLSSDQSEINSLPALIVLDKTITQLNTLTDLMISRNDDLETVISWQNSNTSGVVVVSANDKSFETSNSNVTIEELTQKLILESGTTYEMIFYVKSEPSEDEIYLDSPEIKVPLTIKLNTVYDVEKNGSELVWKDTIENNSYIIIIMSSDGKEEIYTSSNNSLDFSNLNSEIFTDQFTGTFSIDIKVMGNYDFGESLAINNEEIMIDSLGLASTAQFAKFTTPVVIFESLNNDVRYIKINISDAELDYIDIINFYLTISDTNGNYYDLSGNILEEEYSSDITDLLEVFDYTFYFNIANMTLDENEYTLSFYMGADSNNFLDSERTNLTYIVQNSLSSQYSIVQDENSYEQYILFKDTDFYDFGNPNSSAVYVVIENDSEENSSEYCYTCPYSVDLHYMFSVVYYRVVNGKYYFNDDNSIYLTGYALRLSLISMNTLSPILTVNAAIRESSTILYYSNVFTQLSFTKLANPRNIDMINGEVAWNSANNGEVPDKYVVSIYRINPSTTLYELVAVQSVNATAEGELSGYTYNVSYLAGLANSSAYETLYIAVKAVKLNQGDVTYINSADIFYSQNNEPLGMTCIKITEGLKVAEDGSLYFDTTEFSSIIEKICDIFISLSDDRISSDLAQVELKRYGYDSYLTSPYTLKIQELVTDTQYVAFTFVGETNSYSIKIPAYKLFSKLSLDTYNVIYQNSSLEDKLSNLSQNSLTKRLIRGGGYANVYTMFGEYGLSIPEGTYTLKYQVLGTSTTLSSSVITMQQQFVISSAPTLLNNSTGVNGSKEYSIIFKRINSDEDTKYYISLSSDEKIYYILVYYNDTTLTADLYLDYTLNTTDRIVNDARSILGIPIFECDNKGNIDSEEKGYFIIYLNGTNGLINILDENNSRFIERGTYNLRFGYAGKVDGDSVYIAKTSYTAVSFLKFANEITIENGEMLITPFEGHTIWYSYEYDSNGNVYTGSISGASTVATFTGNQNYPIINNLKMQTIGATSKYRIEVDSPIYQFEVNFIKRQMPTLSVSYGQIDVTYGENYTNSNIMKVYNNVSQSVYGESSYAIKSGVTYLPGAGIIDNSSDAEQYYVYYVTETEDASSYYVSSVGQSVSQESITITDDYKIEIAGETSYYLTSSATELHAQMIAPVSNINVTSDIMTTWNTDSKHLNDITWTDDNYIKGQTVYVVKLTAYSYDEDGYSTSYQELRSQTMYTTNCYIDTNDFNSLKIYLSSLDYYYTVYIRRIYVESIISSGVKSGISAITDGTAVTIDAEKVDTSQVDLIYGLSSASKFIYENEIYQNMAKYLKETSYVDNMYSNIDGDLVVEVSLFEESGEWILSRLLEQYVFRIYAINTMGITYTRDYIGKELYTTAILLSKDNYDNQGFVYKIKLIMKLDELSDGFYNISCRIIKYSDVSNDYFYSVISSKIKVYKLPTINEDFYSVDILETEERIQILNLSNYFEMLLSIFDESQLEQIKVLAVYSVKGYDSCEFNMSNQYAVIVSQLNADETQNEILITDDLNELHFEVIPCIEGSIFIASDNSDTFTLHKAEFDSDISFDQTKQIFTWEYSGELRISEATTYQVATENGTFSDVLDEYDQPVELEVGTLIYVLNEDFASNYISFYLQNTEGSYNFDTIYRLRKISADGNGLVINDLYFNIVEYLITDDNVEDMQAINTFKTQNLYYAPTQITGDNEKIIISVTAQISYHNLQSSEKVSTIESFSLFESGSGTSESPYIIATNEQFSNIRYRQMNLNTGDYLYYELAENVDLTITNEDGGIFFEGDFLGYIAGNNANLKYIANGYSSLTNNISVVGGNFYADVNPATYTYGISLFENFYGTINDINYSFSIEGSVTAPTNILIAGFSITNYGIIDNVDLISYNISNYKMTQNADNVISGYVSENYGTISNSSILTNIIVSESTIQDNTTGNLFVAGYVYNSYSTSTLSGLSFGDQVVINVTGSVYVGSSCIQVAGIVISNCLANIENCSAKVIVNIEDSDTLASQNRYFVDDICVYSQA